MCPSHTSLCKDSSWRHHHHHLHHHHHHLHLHHHHHPPPPPRRRRRRHRPHHHHHHLHHHHHHINLHHRHQHRHHDHDHGLGLVDQHLMHGIVDQVPRLLRLTPKHLCSFRIHLQNISDEKGDIEPDYLRKEERALGMLFVLVALEQDGTILKQQGYSRNCASPASLNTMRLGSESSWCEWPNYQHDLRNHGRLQQTICSMYIIWHCMFLHMSGQY